MRVEDVPQEGNATLGGQRKGVYAVGADGRIRLVPSRGWAAEELATTAAVEHFEALCAQALARLRAGQGSALEVFMYARRFDPPTLGRTTGIWRWRVRRHLRRPFSQLGVSLQRRYAEALDLPTQRLLDLERDPHATAEPGHA